MALENLDAQDVARWLGERSIVLIDVREPQEYASERIPGAFLYPLSTFDPLVLRDLGEKKVVFHCGSGGRSARAVAVCEAAGLSIHSHLRGGIQAWKAAKLPTISVDPLTGKLREAK